MDRKGSSKLSINNYVQDEISESSALKENDELEVP